MITVINNILLSKCWGIKAAFHSVNFRPLRFFCWISKESCSDNIELTLGKTFMWKCDINFFEITFPPHRCLLGNFLFIFWGFFLLFICFDDDLYSLYCYWFISINEFKKQTTPGCSSKVFSLYSENSKEN